MGWLPLICALLDSPQASAFLWDLRGSAAGWWGGGFCPTWAKKLNFLRQLCTDFLKVCYRHLSSSAPPHSHGTAACGASLGPLLQHSWCVVLGLPSGLVRLGLTMHNGSTENRSQVNLLLPRALSSLKTQTSRSALSAQSLGETHMCKGQLSATMWGSSDYLPQKSLVSSTDCRGSFWLQNPYTCEEEGTAWTQAGDVCNWPCLQTLHICKCFTCMSDTSKWLLTIFDPLVGQVLPWYCTEGKS